MIGLLRLSSFAATGRGVRIAVIDSGVHAAHPHVQGVSGGIGIDAHGSSHPDYTDRLGHGTAVAAAIREKAPDADLVAVKIFDRELATTSAALIAAIEWSTAHGARLVNLSLGTTKRDDEVRLEAAVSRARDAGVILVAAAPQPSARWLPGALTNVLRVDLDWTLPRHQCRVELADGGEIQAWASGYPRPVPGVPPERNLKGLSFAVANATGVLARLLSAAPANHLADAIAGAIAVESGIVPSS